MQITPESDRRPRRDGGPGLGALWLIGVVIAAGVGAWYFAGRETKPVEPAPTPEVVVPAPLPQAPEPVRFPVPEPPAAEPQPAPEPLPPLGESDAPVRDAVTALVGAESVRAFLVPEDLVRRIVATIDNLPREKVASRIRVVPPLAGNFTVSGSENELILNPANAARYEPFVRAVQAVDAAALAALYFRFYPLFQEAYEELGYPGRYFNDRLVEVIDHLLAAPQAPDTVRLVRPGVYYQYADPKLEALSAGQKTLLRVGRANAVVLKEKLYELRRAVARGAG